MTWTLLQLSQGESFPEHIYWPTGIDAYIPINLDGLSKPTDVNEKLVQLYGREINSDESYPLVWLDRYYEQYCAIDIPRWIEILKKELYREEHKKPISALLPFHFNSIPGDVRNSIESFFVKASSQSGTKKPMFPISLFNGGCEIFIGVCQKRWGVVKLPKLVLTHDIETKEGFDWALKIANIEKSYGFRSSWNIVPKSYDLNRVVLDELVKDGHEIGLHGIWDDNSEPFLKEDKFEQELESIKELIKEYSIKGYRSPSWYKTKHMFGVLSKVFLYDLSCLDNDMLCPAGNGGVGFMRPFVTESQMVELPCTLPFEAPLSSENKPEDLLDFWKPKIDFINESNGLLLVNTRPDPNHSGNEPMLKAYEVFLAHLADQKWENQLPYQVAEAFLEEYKSLLSA